MNPQNILQRSIEQFSEVKIRNSVDIYDFMKQTTGDHDFIQWFNSKIARKKYWGSEAAELVGRTKPIRNYEIMKEQDENFAMTWDMIPVFLEKQKYAGVNLFQFLGITAIIINEHRGQFIPSSEANKKKADDKLPYCFKYYNRKQRKPNHIIGQKTAYELFNDPDFISAHDDFEEEELKLANTQNKKWDSRDYPAKYIMPPEESKMLREADFYKFRGRGLIQTTWRSNYKKLIHQILNYEGDNEVINFYKNDWRDRLSGDVSLIATSSKDEDWDKLFQHTNYEFAALAIKTYNENGQHCFELLMKDPEHLLGEKSGSLYYVGRAVSGSGSSKYGDVVRGRILQMLEQLLTDKASQNN